MVPAGVAAEGQPGVDRIGRIDAGHIVDVGVAGDSVGRAERGFELLAEKRAKGPTTRKTAKKTTRKAPAKKATARKTTAAKTTAAKATATKTAAAKKTTAAKATTKTTAARATKPPTA